MCRDQPRLARNDRCGCLTTGVQQGRGNHQHTSSQQSDPAPSQQTRQPASVMRHHRSSQSRSTYFGSLNLGLHRNTAMNVRASLDRPSRPLVAMITIAAASTMTALKIRTRHQRRSGSAVLDGRPGHPDGAPPATRNAASQAASPTGDRAKLLPSAWHPHAATSICRGCATILRYLNRVGLRQPEAFACPLV
jgi:hypothetical protein